MTIQIKPEKINKLLHIAQSVAELSKDEETKVGSLLVDPKDWAIVAVGYNGFVRNAPDELLPKYRPDKYQYTIHAELNLIINCANHGISTNNKILISTHSPCKSCARLLQNAGIKMIIFSKWYTSSIDLKDIDIQFKFKKINSFIILKFIN